MNTSVLGIDLGGTNMRFGLVAEDGAVTHFEKIRTQQSFPADCDAAERMADIIRDYCSRSLPAGEMPQAVSIGFPSTIDHTRKIVVQTPNIACIPDNFAVVDALTARLGCAVYVNRDVNNLLLYDLQGSGLGTQGNILGIYFGTGIGNAICIDGKMLLGKNGVAAEMGHIPVCGNPRVCTCGNEGCLETLVSGLALERLRAESFPECFIGDVFRLHSDHEKVKTFVRYMAQAVAVEINLFDPEIIFLGGGLLQMAGFPKAELEQLIHYYARKPYPEASIRLQYSRDAQDNGVIGAGLYAQKRLQDPSYR